MSVYPTMLAHYPVYHMQDPLAQGVESPLMPAAPFSGAVHPPRPHLQVSTDYVPTRQADSEYLVREFFTPSPSSSSPSEHVLSALPSAEEATERNRPLPSPASSTRREARRRGAEASSSDEGLVVRGSIAHPYARLYSKKHGAGKRRKMWNHALEKMLFTPQEM